MLDQLEKIMRTTDFVIRLARLHLEKNKEMHSSARLCLDDAVILANNGNYESARIRALKSIAYSVGYFHTDYIDNK